MRSATSTGSLDEWEFFVNRPSHSCGWQEFLVHLLYRDKVIQRIDLGSL